MTQIVLVPRAGGNLVQKQFMLLNDFLLQLSRAVPVPLGARAGSLLCLIRRVLPLRRAGGTTRHSNHTLRVFCWPAGSKINYPKGGNCPRAGRAAGVPAGRAMLTHRYGSLYLKLFFVPRAGKINRFQLTLKTSIFLFRRGARK